MRILETLPLTEIAAALKARVVGTPAKAPRGASIDTRTLEAGDIFFALKGEHTDGHEHVSTAFAKGAAFVVIQDAARNSEGPCSLVVDDPEAALFELGRLIRSKTTATFVAVTGSAGKTTAKDFTAELLRARGDVLATRGNLNNHLGVPLTLARLETGHWAAVLECGMSRAGELSRLAHLLRPKVAVITNVAAAHLEFFASVDAIAAAKGEIFEALGAGDIAVAPAFDPRLSGRARASRGSARLFGEGEGSTVRAHGISMTLEGSTFELECDALSAPLRLPAVGPHAISNLLAAAAVATSLLIPVDVVAKRALHLASAGNRGAVKWLGDDIVLIDDSYNSNPRALLSALETLSLARDRRRIACLGEMRELGPSGPTLHREAGAAMGGHVDLLLGVGALAAEFLAGAVALPESAKRIFGTSEDLAAAINDLVRSRDAVLVKGSRGVRMERVVEALMHAHPGAPA